MWKFNFDGKNCISCREIKILKKWFTSQIEGTSTIMVINKIYTFGTRWAGISSTIVFILVAIFASISWRANTFVIWSCKIKIIGFHVIAGIVLSLLQINSILQWNCNFIAIANIISVLLQYYCILQFYS